MFTEQTNCIRDPVLAKSWQSLKALLGRIPPDAGSVESTGLSLKEPPGCLANCYPEGDGGTHVLGQSFLKCFGRFFIITILFLETFPFRKKISMDRTTD